MRTTSSLCAFRGQMTNNSPKIRCHPHVSQTLADINSAQVKCDFGLQRFHVTIGSCALVVDPLFDELDTDRCKLIVKTSCVLLKLRKAVGKIEWPALTRQVEKAVGVKPAAPSPFSSVPAKLQAPKIAPKVEAPPKEGARGVLV